MGVAPLAVVIATIRLVRASGWWAPLAGTAAEELAALSVSGVVWAATLAAVVARRRGLAGRLGLGRPARRRWWLAGVGVGLAIAIVRVPVMELLVRLGVPVVGNFDPPTAALVGWGLAGTVAGTVVVLPVVEEVVFRGALTGVLARRWSPLLAAAVSTVLFAAGHVTPAGVAHAFVLGAAAAWLTARYRSLWPAVAAHVTVNGVSVALAAAAVRAGVWG